MVKLMDEREVSPVETQIDEAITAAEEKEAMDRFKPSGAVTDLSDGGTVNGVTLFPMEAGQRVEKGRPAARKAWLWNGTPTVLPLAYTPNGKMHDGARRYLLKRHCTCCHNSGFYGKRCPNCIKSHCIRCNGSSDPQKIIANFYLRQEEVPFPTHFYGPVNCFLPDCPRREGAGFLTEEGMRIHAITRHRMEYRAYLDTQAGQRRDELAVTRSQLESLQGRFDALLQAQATPLKTASNGAPSAKRRRASARVRRRATGGVEGR